MHPAFSVILFTTLSGAGYGLLSWAGLYAIAGHLPDGRLYGFTVMALALGAVTVGLLSSTFHLGHPERAWRAFSQWRSSWLSREGVASCITYIPAAIFGTGWVFFGAVSGAWAVAGLIAALCSIVTVICTAYIYRSLKTIPNWYNNWVVPNYVAFSQMTGALLLAALSDLFGYRLPGLYFIAVAAIVVAAVCKIGYWRHIDSAAPKSTLNTATGLPGNVRLFEAPHTSENYLMKEMGYRIARKHARKLRQISVVLAFLVPAGLIATASLVGDVLAMLCSTGAAISAMAGVLTERWLFFAEAKHAVMLFYGRRLDQAA
jgi:DMSO reductase anchor subunit